eukprot:1157829-Pelagomonas_calceolata.AAC.3
MKRGIQGEVSTLKKLKVCCQLLIHEKGDPNSRDAFSNSTVKQHSQEMLHALENTRGSKQNVLVCVLLITHQEEAPPSMKLTMRQTNMFM